jgi:hypothetical protein
MPEIPGFHREGLDRKIVNPRSPWRGTPVPKAVPTSSHPVLSQQRQRQAEQQRQPNLQLRANSNVVAASAKKREEMAAWIKNYWTNHFYAPTVREIQAGLEISSTSVVVYWLVKLRDDGVILFEDGHGRTIRPVNMRIVFDDPSQPGELSRELEEN